MRTTPAGKYCIGSLQQTTYEPILESYSRSIVKLAEFVESLDKSIVVQIRPYTGLKPTDNGWIIWTLDPIRVRQAIREVTDACYDAYAKGKV